MVDRLSPTKERLAELREKHPELLPYAWPATAGDIADLGKKLDEIVTGLKDLQDVIRRLISRSA